MPSNAVLEAKKERVEKLTELIKNSVSGVLVDYKGITVEEDTKLRKELREAGVNYFVEKNTLLLRAFRNCGIEGFEECLLLCLMTTRLLLHVYSVNLPNRQAMRNSISKQAISRARSTIRQELSHSQRSRQRTFCLLSS